MTPAEIKTLLALVGKAVQDWNTPWQRKREAILAEASEDDIINLAELSAWFVYDDEGGEAA